MIEMHLSLPFKLAVLTAVLSATTDLKGYRSGEIVRTRHRRSLLPHISRTIYPLGILPIRPVDKSGGHYLWILMPALKALPTEFLFYATSFLSNIIQLSPIVYILSVDNVVLVNVEVLLNVVVVEAVLVVFEHFP